MLKISKNQKKENSKHIVIRRAVELLILVVLLVLAIININGAFLSDSAIQYYCAHIFPSVSYYLNACSNLFFFSLTENLFIVLVVAAIPLLVLFIITIVHKARRLGAKAVGLFLYKFASVVVAIAFIVVVVFQMMFGYLYRREQIATTLKLETNREYEDLNEALEDYRNAATWAYSNMLSARAELGEDYNGVAHMQTNLEQSVYDANMCVEAFAQIYDVALSTNYIRVKPVSLSNLWSLTSVVGMNNPLFGEAIVNTSYIDVTQFPLILTHEISHAKGIAREGDANFIAAISCCISNRADFRYAGFLELYLNYYAEAYMIEEALGLEHNSITTPYEQSDFAPVIRDFNASYQFYESIYDSGVGDLIYDVSEDINDAYLESNGQEGGTETYNVQASSYLEFYLQYVQVGVDTQDESST